MEDINLTSTEDEHLLEEIRGETQKKPKMSLLNQKKINNWEMDELFSDDSSDEYEEEF